MKELETETIVALPQRLETDTAFVVFSQSATAVNIALFSNGQLAVAQNAAYVYIRQ